MDERLEKVSTQNLKLGMYVERLDRPWTETPFLFQGFYIHDQDDIAELQRHCAHVYVDRERGIGGDGEEGSSRTITRVNALKPPPPKPVSRAEERYPREVQVEQELGAAKTVHAEATRAVIELLEKARDERRLDVDLATRTVTPIMASVLRNPDALVWLTRMKERNAYIYRHSVNASVWGMAFARQLGLDKQAMQEIGLGCMLFDIGKMQLPAELLERAGPLNPAERTQARSHVTHSLTMLVKSGGVTQRTLDLVRSHHERFDGSGYPAGLKANEIPTFAKIAGIVDCYDALTSSRPYAKLRTPHEALTEIYSWRGKLFQPEVVEQFMQLVGVFPTGSLVELNTGAVGVVIAQNETRRLRPRLMLVLDERKKRLHRFEVIDLMYDSAWQDVEKFWIERHVQPGTHGLDPQELYL
ncbi:MAG TPA: HD-GYP domain-containing protein [Gammaproteobacteria bacterium]|nr:HD-GYP domain-containing protein [Gammaproteobacteria bacterium]